MCHFRTQHNVGDNDTFDKDTFVAEVCVQVFKHTLSVLCASERVGLHCLDRSTHGTHALLDIGIDQLVDLGHIRRQLLNVVLLLRELEQQGQTDGDVRVVECQNIVIWTLVDEVLHGYEILGLRPRQARKKACLLIGLECTTPVQNSNDTIGYNNVWCTAASLRLADYNCLTISVVLSEKLMATGWLLDADRAEPSLLVRLLRDDRVFPIKRHIR